VLTQTCDLETLLNANYYIGDIRGPEGLVNLNDDSLSYADDGSIRVVRSEMSRAIGRYHIKYDKNVTLDPTCFISTVLASTHQESRDPRELFIDFLKTQDSLINVYEFLFQNEIKGNGLQILIFNDENTIKNFCDIICDYLSSVFGCDILFIDPNYRPNVKGMPQYKGCDKETARRNIMQIRDMKLLRDFKLYASYNAENTLSNLSVFLSSFDCPSLIHLYNLLFPNEPLPPDNYTRGQLQEIVIGKTTKNLPRPALSNILFADSKDFFDYTENYDD